MLPSVYTADDLKKIDKEKRKFIMTPDHKVKYDAWAKAVEKTNIGQDLHILTQKLVIAFLGWSKQMGEKPLDAGWLQEFEKEFKNKGQVEVEMDKYEIIFRALRKQYPIPASGDGNVNNHATSEDVAAFLETIPAPLSNKEKEHLGQYNNAKFQIWKQFRKSEMEFGAFQKEVQKYPEIAELVKKADDKADDKDVNKDGNNSEVEKIINTWKDKTFQESSPLIAKFFMEKYFLAFQKELDEKIARLVIEARDENFASKEKVEKIIDFCKIKAVEESRISQFFRESDLVAFQKEMDDIYPGYRKFAQLVIEASEENFANKEKVELMIRCCEELPMSKIFKKEDFDVIKREVNDKYRETIIEEDFTKSEQVERIIISCRDKAFQNSKSSISKYFEKYDILMGAVFGQKSAEIEKMMEETAVDYFFQLVGFVVSLIPFVPPQITDYISSFGKKVNEWSGMKTEAHDLVTKAQSFLTLLLSTSLQLSEFHGEDHNAVEKLCELIDDMAYLYDLQFQECKSMLDNPPKVFGFGKIWKRTFDSALEALTEIAADTRDKVSLYTSTVASRTLDEVGKQGKILEFLKREQSSLAIELESNRTELKQSREELNSNKVELQKTQQSLESKEHDLKETEKSLQLVKDSLKGYERVVALTSQATAKINAIKISIWHGVHNRVKDTQAEEDSFEFFENNIVFGALLYCYGMYHEFEALIQKIEEIQETVNHSAGGLLQNYSVRSDANFAGLHLKSVHNVRLCLTDIKDAKLYEQTSWRWKVTLEKVHGKWVVKFRNGVKPVYTREAIVDHQAWWSVLDKLNYLLGGAEIKDTHSAYTTNSHDSYHPLGAVMYNLNAPFPEAKLSIGEEYPKRKSKKEKQVDDAP
ncbi:hypothetical protein HDU84_003786 [Entophlyctis sp. JEL0112]|nr:hypothetical protein HDU84_003786 [Entophlyctis sp. JEL0112]